MKNFCHCIKNRIGAILLFLCASIIFLSCFNPQVANAMPFYDLKPQAMVLRASFYTTYSSSTDERKNNIKVASRYLDNTFVDVGAEFSFNNTVGERTVSRGFQKAKIIVDGEFVDGVGGGVCQVSTTLYNAVILSGLLVTEFHSHSLPVSYVAPSFDAMVNSGWADLRFINNTHNPIIIRAVANDSKIVISIYGEKLDKKYQRQSVVTQIIEPPESKILYDDAGEYPNLYEDEFLTLRYAKSGLKSEAYLIVDDGKSIVKQKLRSDKYNAMRGVIIYGKAQRE